MSAVARMQIAEMNELWSGGEASGLEWFATQMMVISDGGGMPEIVKARGWNHGVFRNWIAADEGREKLYLEACGHKKEIRTNRVEDEAFAVAMTEVEISESSKMKALDMLRNPKGGVTVSADGGKITIIHESA